jgi:hypothetical protein
MVEVRFRKVVEAFSFLLDARLIDLTCVSAHWADITAQKEKSLETVKGNEHQMNENTNRRCSCGVPNLNFIVQFAVY